MTVSNMRESESDLVGGVSLPNAKWKIFSLWANDCLANGPINWLSCCCRGERS